MKRKILSIILAITLLFSMFSLNVFANQTVSVYLDNQPMQFDVPPQIINGRTMVPLRAIFEKLGATVNWDGTTQTCIATTESYRGVDGMIATITIQIDNKIGTLKGYYSDSLKKTLIEQYGETLESLKQEENEVEQFEMDVAPMIIGGRTLVPLRAISEAFACEVQWDGTTSSVKIFSNNLNINTQTNSDTKIETIKMATNAEFPPYEFKDGNEFKGIDIDIANKIADELGMILEIVDVDFDAIIPSVMQEKVDFGIAGMTITDERKTVVNFTLPYVKSSQVVIVDKNSDIKHLDELEGKIIGTQIGTIAEIYSTSDYGSNVIVFNDYDSAVLALKTGSIEAIILDDQNAQIILNKNTELKILDTEYAYEEYAIVINKENTELLAKMNSIITKLISNGTIDSIVKNYTLSN